MTETTIENTLPPSLYEPGYRAYGARQRFDIRHAPTNYSPHHSTELSSPTPIEKLYDPIQLMYFKGGPNIIDEMRFRRTMAIMRGLKKFVEWRKETVE